ncbi:hypothetical protein PR048_007554 [Dryococelus australis]|uniref:Uncharacterized protein n=1 Tax=Dryococelus australis TaxID=614101 RepID=A0ABQ9HW85_9NEOP|nr:hypothetical protein PR048_007554 [Dryococelus australis]
MHNSEVGNLGAGLPISSSLGVPRNPLYTTSKLTVLRLGFQFPLCWECLATLAAQLPSWQPTTIWNEPTLTMTTGYKNVIFLAKLPKMSCHPVAQSVGAPPIWVAGGSGFESRRQLTVGCHHDSSHHQAALYLLHPEPRDGRWAPRCCAARAAVAGGTLARPAPEQTRSFYSHVHVGDTTQNPNAHTPSTHVSISDSAQNPAWHRIKTFLTLNGEGTIVVHDSGNILVTACSAIVIARHNGNTARHLRTLNRYAVRCIALIAASGRGSVVVRQLAYHRGEPSSIPRRGRPRISARGNRVARCGWSADFLGDIPFSPTPAFQRCSVLTSLYSHWLSMFRASTTVQSTLYRSLLSVSEMTKISGVGCSQGLRALSLPQEFAVGRLSDARAARTVPAVGDKHLYSPELLGVRETCTCQHFRRPLVAMSSPKTTLHARPNYTNIWSDIWSVAHSQRYMNRLRPRPVRWSANHLSLGFAVCRQSEHCLNVRYAHIGSGRVKWSECTHRKRSQGTGKKADDGEDCMTPHDDEPDEKTIPTQQHAPTTGRLLPACPGPEGAAAAADAREVGEGEAPSGRPDGTLPSPPPQKPSSDAGMIHTRDDGLSLTGRGCRVVLVVWTDLAAHPRQYSWQMGSRSDYRFGGFPRGHPVSPALAYSPHFTPIGSQDLYVKRRRNISTPLAHSRLDSAVMCTNMPISTVHWLSVVPVEGDDWARVNPELSSTMWTNGRTVSLLASHQDEPGSIPGRVTPGIFASGNRAGRCRWSAGSLGYLPFPPPLHSGAAPFSPHFTLIGSQDLVVKSHPNLSTQHSPFLYDSLICGIITIPY